MWTRPTTTLACYDSDWEALLGGEGAPRCTRDAGVPEGRTSDSAGTEGVADQALLKPGDGFLIDSTKFGMAVIRESISLRQGTSEDDFVRNLLRWVCEERLTLATERPQAVLMLSNLPTTVAPGS